MDHKWTTRGERFKPLLISILALNPCELWTLYAVPRRSWLTVPYLPRSVPVCLFLYIVVMYTHVRHHKTVDYDAQDDSIMAKQLVEAGIQDIAVGTPIFVTVEDADAVAAFADFTVDAAPPPQAEEPAPVEVATPPPPPPPMPAAPVEPKTEPVAAPAAPAAAPAAAPTVAVAVPAAASGKGGLLVLGHVWEVLV